jgi:hypothetical protein
MTTKTTKLTMNELYWSERGNIGCLKPGHSPYRGSDSWHFDRWKKIKPAEAEAFRREIGRMPECECCRADRRREQEQGRDTEQPQ